MSQIQPPNHQAPPDLFRSSDLGVSAFLTALGFPLLRVDWDGQRAVFAFPESARDRALLYRQPGRNLVEAHRFHQSLRELRGLARDAGERR
jgi:hypothetical protein